MAAADYQMQANPQAHAAAQAQNAVAHAQSQTALAHAQSQIAMLHGATNAQGQPNALAAANQQALRQMQAQNAARTLAGGGIGTGVYRGAGSPGPVDMQRAPVDVQHLSKGVPVTSGTGGFAYPRLVQQLAQAQRQQMQMQMQPGPGTQPVSPAPGVLPGFTNPLQAQALQAQALLAARQQAQAQARARQFQAQAQARQAAARIGGYGMQRRAGGYDTQYLA